MSPGAQVDYDALAKQYGATAAPAPAQSPAPVDYDSIAQQHGAIQTSDSAPQPQGWGDTVERYALAAGHFIKNVLPHPDAPPALPAQNAEDWAKLPDEQKQQFLQQVNDYQAKRMAGSVNIAANLMGAPKAASEAASVAGKVADVVAPESRLINPAKEAFNAVRQAAQDSGLQVKTSNAMKTALDLRDYANLTKEYVPAPVRGFLERLVPGKSPLPGYEMQKPPLNYDEARKLYSATATLSRDEMAKLSPTMAAKVQAFKSALGDSIESAADSIGKQKQYSFAMQKFAQGMKAIAQREQALELAKKAAIKSVIPAGLYGIYRELSK